MKETVDEFPVTVVGAGPAGLAAAITLARAGVQTLVVEQRSGPSTLPRANSISTATMERMRAWGLADRLREAEVPLESRGLATATMAVAADATPIDLGFPSGEQSAALSPVGPACIAQNHLEPILEDHLRALPAATMRRETEFADLEVEPAGVEFTVRERGAAPRRVRSQFLIAADGVRGGVRDALGIGSFGVDNLGERLALSFRAPLWERLGEHRYTLYLLTGEREPGFFVPTGHPDRWIYGDDWDSERDRLADVTPEEATRRIRHAADMPDLEIELERIDAVTYATRLADSFRSGPVFLAGDAAHQVTPRGGTGLNAAIAGGFDLGWKLAWVLGGWADGCLLDTYEADRRPVVAANVERSARPDGSTIDAAEGLRVDLGGRIAHVWVPDGASRRSTLDLLGPGLTLFTAPGGGEWMNAARALEAAVPVTGRELDAVSARALGFGEAGALLVRPDAKPVALWAGDRAAGERLLAAVAEATASTPSTLCRPHVRHRGIHGQPRRAGDPARRAREA